MIVSFVTSPFISLLNDKSISLDILFFSFLLILMPLVLITGPAIPDVFLSLIALYFLIKSILKKEWEYYSNPIVYGFLLFCFYAIIRSIFSEMPIESLTTGGSVFYFRYIFFALAVWYLLDNNPYLSKCLLNISIICIVFVCIDALYQYFFEVNFFGNKKHSVDRLTGLFGDEPIIGRYVAYLSTFVFVLIYQNYSNHRIIMILTVFFLVLCEVVVFLSGERAPLFNFFLFSILIITFISNFRIYKIATIALSLVIIFFISSINPNAKERIIDFTIKQVNQTQLPFLPYSDHHEEHYISAYKMFDNEPIFGVGTNLFRFQCNKLEYKYKERSCSTHPHNFYFQVLAELGILGLSFLLIFYMYISSILIKKFFYFLKFNKEKKITIEVLLYAIVLIIFWFPLIPHMSFYNNWNNVLMILPLGFFMRYLYGNKNNGNY